MNKRTLLLLMAPLCLLEGCRSNRQFTDVVKETYFHKFGTPTTLNDWQAHGEEGQVVRLHKDGVTVTTNYEQGVVHGETSYTFPNSSTIHRIERYRNGQLISKREHYPSGIPMKEECFAHGVVVQLNQWYEDGTPQVIEHYKNTFLNNGEYHNPFNVVESRVTDGHGTRTLRSNEGELLYRDSIQNGQLIERITYYSNGDPSAVIAYENGVPHGTRLTFLKGGLPHTVEQWEHGVQEGITTLYQNGERFAEIPYIQGLKHGTEKHFRDGSLLVEEITWRQDIQHGERKLYVDGKPSSEWYHQGELVSRSTFERLNLPHRAV